MDDTPRLIRQLNAAHRTLSERRPLFSAGLIAAGVGFFWPMLHSDPALLANGQPAMGVLSLLLGLLLATLPVSRFIALFFLHERLSPRPAHPAEALWALEVAQESPRLDGLVRPWKDSRTAMPRHVVIRVWARWRADMARR